MFNNLINFNFFCVISNYKSITLLKAIIVNNYLIFELLLLQDQIKYLQINVIEVCGGGGGEAPFKMYYTFIFMTNLLVS